MPGKTHGVKCLVVLALVSACGASQPAAKNKNGPGVIIGLVRDTVTGEMIPRADIEVAGQRTKSNDIGLYEMNVPPGRYTLTARTDAAAPLTIKNIDVSPNQATYVDVSFTQGAAPGEQPAIEIDWNARREDEIQRFTTKAPRIEGTVSDTGTRERVPGAVVTAARGAEYETYQTVTDDHGRYVFDRVDPGTYAISAYYSLGGRAQIEVRRSDITVTNEQGVLVPLWIELAKRQ